MLNLERCKKVQILKSLKNAENADLFVKIGFDTAENEPDSGLRVEHAIRRRIGSHSWLERLGLAWLQEPFG